MGLGWDKANGVVTPAPFPSLLLVPIMPLPPGPVLAQGPCPQPVLQRCPWAVAKPVLLSHPLALPCQEC